MFNFKSIIIGLIITIFSFNFIFADTIVIPKRYYDYVIDASNVYNVPKEYIIAVMLTENRNMNEKAINKNTNGTLDRGLMQINTVHDKQLKSMGLDVYNPKDNIMYSAFLLRRAIDIYKNNKHAIFMTYNNGEGGVKNNLRNGIYSTKYSRKVMSYLSNIDNITIDNSENLNKKDIKNNEKINNTNEKSNKIYENRMVENIKNDNIKQNNFNENINLSDDISEIILNMELIDENVVFENYEVNEIVVFENYEVNEIYLFE